jgi:hypothetical protein
MSPGYSLERGFGGITARNAFGTKDDDFTVSGDLKSKTALSIITPRLEPILINRFCIKRSPTASL